MQTLSLEKPVTSWWVCWFCNILAITLSRKWLHTWLRVIDKFEWKFDLLLIDLCNVSSVMYLFFRICYENKAPDKIFSSKQRSSSSDCINCCYIVWNYWPFQGYGSSKTVYLNVPMFELSRVSIRFRTAAILFWNYWSVLGYDSN